MRYLTVTETAERLGVKRETVYAYVSRGLLTSVRGAQRRGSRFAQDEVERLAARGRDAGAPSGAVERIRTEVTLVSDDGPFYRGVRVPDLAASATPEATARLLWRCADEPTFAPDPALLAVARAAVAALPGEARQTDRFRVAVAAAAAADPLRADTSAPAVTAAASALLGTAVAALDPDRGGPTCAEPDGAGPARRGPGSGGPGTGGPGTGGPGSGGPGSGGPGSAAPGSGGLPSLAARLWPVLGGRPGPGEDLLRIALVLLADHGLAVSTVAARVAASARAGVYAVLSAGLGALDGPHHGLVSSQAHRFLADALPDPVGAVAERLRAGQRIPGFGHLVYRGPDPRATMLFERLRADPAAADVLATVDAVRARMAPAPNVDLAIAALLHAHGLRPDAGELIFGVARSIGWVAHALEEYAEPGLRFRPVGVYVGPLPS